MANIRPIAEDDIPQLVALRKKCFAQSEQPDDASLEQYFNRIFFQSPWSRAGPCAFVCEDKNGKVVGMHGRIRKRMQFGRDPGTMLVGTHLMADPDAGGFAAVQLTQQLFRGDHDLYIADSANEPSRLLWAGLGGAVIHAQSLTWLKPLVGRYYLRHLGSGLAAKSARFLANCAFAAKDRLRRTDSAALSEYELTDASPEQIATAMQDYARKKTITPLYDPAELRWVFDQIDEGKSTDRSVTRFVARPNGEPVGWFAYLPRPDDFARVLAVVARNDDYGLILDALIDDATSRGCHALRGRVEPGLMEALGTRDCTITRSGPWMLAHSPRPEIMQAVHRGDARITLIDGERWLRF